MSAALPTTKEELAVAHAYARGWNAAIEAAAKVAEGAPANVDSRGEWTEATQGEIAYAIRALDKSSQATTD